jgi:4-amino-4-deoxy-L-arabinose transferase-like glycosyltransferase
MQHSATRARVVEVLLVVGVLGALVAFVAPTLRQPLLERHGFRQTQTAFQARVFYEEGIDLGHPQVPVLGEPFEIPFEFPLLQAGASIVIDLGVEEDLAMRLSGLACFLTTALFLYGLVRQVAGPVAAFGALVAFTLTPFALLWSRTSMIEYLATAGAVGFTWAFVARRESGRPLLGALALVAGSIGMLVKPTTAVFWILPALLYRPVSPKSARGRRRLVDPWTVVIVGVPIVVALLWTRHADAVKAASQTTVWLTSGELRS